MQTVIHSDFTVVGAGIAGMCAAIAAARNGLRVSLINDRDVPGGNASSEHRVHINGGATGNSSFYSRESGIADEIKLYELNRNPRYNRKKDFHLCDMAFYQILRNEPNISLFLGTAVYDCDCENGKISRAYAVKPHTGEQLVFESPIFCDASGDGVLAYKSGADYRVGREARSEFDESLAPESADSHVMGSCVLFHLSKNDGEKVSYKKPDFAYDFIKDDILKWFDRPETGRSMPKVGGNYNGMWWLEYGGMSDTIKQADQIDFELRKLIYGYWDYIKNSGKYPDSECYSIDWIAPYASKRESRRFIGKYIMKQSDIQNSVDFDDAVSTGGWSLDIHDVGGIYGSESTSAFGEVKSMYNIPLSIMYSKDIDNLFLAGRIVSCTHVALGSLRVMETLGAMGQAVGTTAALCKKYKALPDDVRNEHITELQAVLQHDGQYIIGKKEDCGLAASAKITASSVKKLENLRDEICIPIDDNKIFTLPNVQSVKIRIKNAADSDVICKYRVYSEDERKNYRCGKMLGEYTAKIPTKFDGWHEFSFDKASGEKIFLELLPNESLYIFGSHDRVTGAPSFYSNNDSLAKFDDAVTFCFSGVDDDRILYASENVVNGYSRPFGTPNCWISDGKGEQWLDFSFDEPQDIDEIQIYFNPRYETEHFNGPIEQLVTDYSLTVYTSNGSKSIDVRGNCITRNSFAVNKSDVVRVRFDFAANNGSPEYEVFAVKMF